VIKLDPPTAAIVFAAEDASIVERLQRMLAGSVELDVNCEKGVLRDGESFLEKIDALWHAGLTVVLLRQESVPVRWVAEEWQQTLWTEPEENGVLVCCVQTGGCHLPELIRRRRPGYQYFDARENADGAIVAMRRWLMELRRGSDKATFIPATAGLEDDVVPAVEAIVERPGVAVVQSSRAVGKTEFALQFAHRHVGDFEDIIWVSCTGRSLPEVASELASLFEVRLPLSIGEGMPILRQHIESRRVLLVLDGVGAEAFRMLVPRRRASCLITTRVPWEDAVVLEERMEERSRRVSTGQAESLHATFSQLARCRSDWMMPEMIRALGVDPEVLLSLDRISGARRAPGWVHDLELDPSVEEDLELHHAQAVMKALESDRVPSLIPDVLLALRRLAALEHHAPLVASLARRGEQICRHHQRYYERELILRTVVEAGWMRRDSGLMEKFAGDLITLYEESDRTDEAEMWRPRLRQMVGGQLWLSFDSTE
jgi:hypothetical protein